MEDPWQLPRTHVVLGTAALGFLVGLSVLAFGWWDWSDKQIELAHTGPVLLWMGLVCLQTLFWFPAAVIFWRARKLWAADDTNRDLNWLVGLVDVVAVLVLVAVVSQWLFDEVFWTFAVLAAVLVGLIVFDRRRRGGDRRYAEVWLSTAFTASLGVGLLALGDRMADSTDVITHGHYKVWTLSLFGFGVSLLGLQAVWWLRVQLLALRSASLENLRRYLDMRREVERLLVMLGGVVGLAVLSTAAFPAALEECRPPAPLLPLCDGDASLPPQLVILFGIGLSLILILAFAPTFLTLVKVGADLRDHIAPLRDPADSGFEEGLGRRESAEKLLGLHVSGMERFKAGLALLAPLLASLTSLFPEFSG